VNPSNAGRRLPGTTLLMVARLLLSEHLVLAVIEPTIADLQCEVAAAANRVGRLSARWRGYRAFWTLILIGAFAPWAVPVPHANAAAFPDAVHLAIGLTIFTLVTVLHPVLGAVLAVVATAGVLCAIVIHAWYRRHPSELPTPRQRLWRSPQINFSSTDVAGNSGGLIFVGGTIVILALGLPSILCFLLAGTVAGCVVARGLVEWRTRHPQGDQPENRIVWR
jgi:hypothetical protein